MRTHRIFVEKHSIHASERTALLREIREVLNITELKCVRHVLYYNVFDITREKLNTSLHSVFAEVPRTWVYYSLAECLSNTQELPNTVEYFDYIAIEPLPTQYDQRADAAEQGMHLLGYNDCRITTGEILLLYHSTAEQERKLNDETIDKITSYIINPIEMRLSQIENLPTRKLLQAPQVQTSTLYDFVSYTEEDMRSMQKNLGLSLCIEDLQHIQNYYKNEEKRPPTLTELRFLDTYWSDHCRHTTFLTQIEKIVFSNIEDEAIQSAWHRYMQTRNYVYQKHNAQQKPITLMDIATIATQALALRGVIDDVEFSEEVNACSIKVNVTVNGKSDPWLLMFKNETHNHPTEIEPYGGSSTCLGGAIRDPLSGRSYVFSAMRITGSADPREKIEKTYKGKLPQRLITQKAAAGFSAYGNQIGLACPYVRELYHPGYKAKRLEAGFVMGATPIENVCRSLPKNGDIIMLVGGRTGRDGIGGAVGSSKGHNATSLENAASEVQKGNAIEERKIQRLFKNPHVSRLIKRCNDFGAGGLSVAVSEIADGVYIKLDAVRLKYQGLTPTEIALSESQERMAVVISAENYKKFSQYARRENVEAYPIAKVTDRARVVMMYEDKTIVNIARSFLESKGATKKTTAVITHPKHMYAISSPWHNPRSIKSEQFWHEIEQSFTSLEYASHIGLQEMFDSTVGAGTVLMPYGGSTQTGQEEGSAVLFPITSASYDETNTSRQEHKYTNRTSSSTVAISTASCPLALLEQSPFHGASYAVVDSLNKIAVMGANPLKARLSFQEYFKRMENPDDWGQSLSAMLGAFDAQMQLQIPAIGGKDSMSGSFDTMHVPPTFISFAVATEEQERVRSTQIVHKNMKLYLLLHIPKSDGSPNYSSLTNMWKWLYNQGSYIPYAAAVGERNILHTIINMCAGNNIGCDLKFSQTLLDSTRYGSIILASHISIHEATENMQCIPIGKTKVQPYLKWKTEHGVRMWKIRDIVTKMQNVLQDAFPYRTTKNTILKKNTTPSPIQGVYKNHTPIKQFTKSRPRVCIPVFPGTNCEYDTAYAFESVGAVCYMPVFCNKTKEDISHSLYELAKSIGKSNILACAGGFSAADEPDGAGKFISLILQNVIIKNAITNLLNRDGLIIGICNGFQALIKSGLLPFNSLHTTSNDVQELQHSLLSSTLTTNTLGKHISRMVKTQVVNTTISPWLSLCKVKEHYWIPISHGEGRFVIDDTTLAMLQNNKQIVSIYAEENPNGSMQEIEGLVSEDGRILGRMGHVERVRNGIYKNIPGFKIQPIIESGVTYFL